jgi:hypothetical protein
MLFLERTRSRLKRDAEVLLPTGKSLSSDDLEDRPVVFHIPGEYFEPVQFPGSQPCVASVDGGTKSSLQVSEVTCRGAIESDTVELGKAGS